MGKFLIGVVLVCADGAGAQSPPGTPLQLLTRFAADRVFVLGVTIRGDTLFFYTDTGGGTSMIDPATVSRLKLPVDSVVDGREVIRLALMPEVRTPPGIPSPSPVAPFGGRLFITPMQPGLGRDGFLGRTWFATRVWLFDYPRQELWLLPPEATRTAGAHTVSLGFQIDSSGKRTTEFPRIEARVDGDTLHFLFDTGATLFIADSARSALGHPAHSEVGTSFITEEIFQRWRSRHPDWPVIERGERTTGASLIRAANLRIAGFDTGPVWFTVRPNRSFHEYMAQWMDRRLDGALGGSAFGGFRIRLDYVHATASFER